MKRPTAIWTMLGALSCVSSCGKPHPTAAQQPLPPFIVETQAASVRTLPSPEQYVGNINSRKAVLISSKMMGRVLRMYVSEGQRVKKGQMLVHIDASEARSAYQQAHANLIAADIAQRNAQRDYDRFKTLHENDVITGHQLEQVETALALATAETSRAKANLASSGVLLSYGRIVAPQDGIITKKWMDPGNVAGPGAPMLTLEDPHQLELSVAVPESRAGRLSVGQKAQVQAPNQRVEAVVEAVIRAADPRSRTSTVKLALPPSTQLTPGQFASVQFDAFTARALTVPVSALISEGQMDGVFVVQGPIARRRWIQVGQRTPQTAQVLSGLQENELVIVPIPPGLRDGWPVQVQRIEVVP